MDNIASKTENTNKPEKDKKVNKFDIKAYLMYGVLVIVLLFAFAAYFKAIKKGKNKNSAANSSYSFVKKSNKFVLLRKIYGLFSFTKSSSSPGDSKKLKSQNLVLNGVVISGGNKFALINNIIVNEGDRIGDALVLQITSEYVELESSALRFKLTPYKK